MRSSPDSFSFNVLRSLVFPQSHESRVPQAVLAGPFEELELTRVPARRSKKPANCLEVSWDFARAGRYGAIEVLTP